MVLTATPRPITGRSSIDGGGTGGESRWRLSSVLIPARGGQRSITRFLSWTQRPTSLVADIAVPLRAFVSSS